MHERMIVRKPQHFQRPVSLLAFILAFTVLLSFKQSGRVWRRAGAGKVGRRTSGWREREREMEREL